MRRGPWTGVIRPTLLALAAVALTACVALPDGPSPALLQGTIWRLVSLPGHALPAASGLSLQFEGTRAFGSDGCNRFSRFSRPYALTGGELRLGPSAGTRRACAGDVSQRAEAYARALGQVTRYRVVGTAATPQLELLASDGRTVAAFAAQSQALAGTRWEVTGIHDGRQAVVSVLEGTRLTLAFDESGRLSGSAGCNRFMARYDASAASLRIEAPSGTRMACQTPGMMVQEQALLRALQAVRKARIEGEVLELRDGEGALQVSAQVSAPADRGAR